ncbi:ABC transporter [Salinisphaera orenii MK-B5]|uniref:ABC transporter n=1 Tax=Salinisphaera orenii MK-B5 TaxID=856730 RepID=A0A423PP80_9GAMM|nr:ABC transporter ATP-binding protein [Salinisphaera orenii]ROO27368.1 ABC transporter [Salinisphaera orenii MK-B5]
MSLLEVQGINSHYGDSHILFDVDMRVEANEVVALLGRNGAGKSTTLKSLMGVVTPTRGQVRFDGQDVAGRPPFEIARRGMQLVPEERRIIGTLSVHENLKLAALSAGRDAWSFERVYEFFPRLQERRRSRGKDLSGGEQQMLAIGRALIRNAKLILLDEPFEGLAPIIVRDLMASCQQLAREGQTFLVVEQNVAAALRLADRCYLIENGHMVYEGSAEALRDSPEVMDRYLGV